MLLAFNKPYGVLSQFTPEPGSPHRTLAEFGFPPDVYPIGRLDADSEGLLLLSDEKGLNTTLLDPERGHRRTYWVQVEGVPTAAALQRLEKGVEVKGRRTHPCHAAVLLPQPLVADRVPPIRSRVNIPTTWIELTLTEGKNRQVRRMTAAVGFPTLRLIRIRIGHFGLDDLSSGSWRRLTSAERALILDQA